MLIKSQFMDERAQRGNTITVPHQDQRNILTTSFANEIMECIERILNTILNAHHTYIDQQIRPSSFQLRFRCDQLQTLQIRTIAYYKYPVSWAATTFDSKPSLR